MLFCCRQQTFNDAELIMDPDARREYRPRELQNPKISLASPRAVKDGSIGIRENITVGAWEASSPLIGQGGPGDSDLMNLMLSRDGSPLKAAGKATPGKLESENPEHERIRIQYKRQVEEEKRRLAAEEQARLEKARADALHSAASSSFRGSPERQRSRGLSRGVSISPHVAVHDIPKSEQQGLVTLNRADQGLRDQVRRMTSDKLSESARDMSSVKDSGSGSAATPIYTPAPSPPATVPVVPVSPEPSADSTDPSPAPEPEAEPVVVVEPPAPAPAPVAPPPEEVPPPAFAKKPADAGSAAAKGKSKPKGKSGAVPKAKAAGGLGLRTKDPKKMLDLMDPKDERRVYAACNFVRPTLSIAPSANPLVTGRDEAFCLWLLLYSVRLYCIGKQNPIETAIGHAVQCAPGPLSTTKSMEQAKKVAFFAERVCKPVITALNSGEAGEDVGKQIAADARVMMGEKPDGLTERLDYLPNIMSSWKWAPVESLYSQDSQNFDKRWAEFTEALEASSRNASDETFKEAMEGLLHTLGFQ